MLEPPAVAGGLKVSPRSRISKSLLSRYRRLIRYPPPPNDRTKEGKPMSLRRIIFSLLVVCLSLIGLACGLLCLVCLVAYVLLHGLGVGSAFLALLCLSCLGLAVMLSGRAPTRESKRLGGAGRHTLKTWRPSRRGIRSEGVQ